MSPEEFKTRTFDYALRIVRLAQALPKEDAAREIGRQLLRSGMSVGANYRAAARARSRADFAAKPGIVEEECDETLYWIEIRVALGFVKQKLVQSLVDEGNEILSMTIASIQTARLHRKQ